MADNQVILTFGGGLNARRRVVDVALDECVAPSENFDLDPQFRALNRRKPFDLVGTAPNGAAVNGFAQLIKQDNSISTLVQAGGNVYSWDGDTTFSLVGTVSTNAKLRGPRDHNFTVDEYVVITDLNKAEVVKKWDGTTFTDLAHDLGGDFFAKYARVYFERILYGNVKTTTDTPHLLVSSAIGDGEDLSNSDRPSSSLGTDVAWFLPMPDLRPLNGLEGAFGEFLLSTERGRLWRLSGTSAKDFKIEEFHVGSAVVGEEAIKNIGNDVVMGLVGRIESLKGTLNFGDVEANDLSLPIAPLIENVTGWTIEYDRKLQKVFCFPNNQSVLWVLHKNVLNDPENQLSPWSKWVTTHDIGFNPTTVMQLVNPLNNQDVVYFGDTAGNIYRLDGEGVQDGGTDDLTVKRRSRMFAVPEGNTFDVAGWIHYRKLFASTVTIRILGGGVAIYTQEITRNLPASTSIAVYGGSHHYGDATSTYGVSFTGRIHRQDWGAAGQSSHFQVEVEITGNEDIDLEEVGIEFNVAKT
ncbi:MAG TPA: hypothetical protein ENH62_01145 [Marinobacter sp.]|nr:hypothetical protein [Marinobacter sp.]